jgi:sterol desaturase/sphingolipid hydroxylase (fatty acid hydroxylase superfamily)
MDRQRVLADLISYWVHRAVHRGRLWRFHAVHHSTESLDWLAGARVHPLNEALNRVALALPLLALGFDTESFATVAPVLGLHGLLLHASVGWDFGPLRLVIASPRFHRWHHARDVQGVNFAGLFPVWDLLFGTLHLPRHEQPTRFRNRRAGASGQVVRPACVAVPGTLSGRSNTSGRRGSRPGCRPSVTNRRVRGE